MALIPKKGRAQQPHRRIPIIDTALTLLAITLLFASTMQTIPTAICTTSSLQTYLDILVRLKQQITAGDRDTSALIIDELIEADSALTLDFDSVYYKLNALQPQAIAKISGFEGNYTVAVDSYSKALTIAADFYSSLAGWLGDEDANTEQLLTSLSAVQEATQKAWDSLTTTLTMTAGLKVPAILVATLDVPYGIAYKESMEVVANVTNYGDEAAINVLAKVSTDSTLEVKSPATFALQNIAPGGTSQAKWTLGVSHYAEPGDAARLWVTVEGENLEPFEVNSATTVTFGDEGSLEFTVHSPVLMLVTDFQGRSVGFDPNSDGVLNEIDGATYTGRDSSPQTITVPDPLGLYRVDLLGTADGAYRLEIKAMEYSKVSSTQSINGTAKKATRETILAPVELDNDALILTSGETLPWVQVHEVRFDYDKLWKPSDIWTGAKDTRELSFAFEALEFLDADGITLGEIAVGSEGSQRYLEYGWNDDVEGREANSKWAGGPAKYAIIRTRMPEGTQYLRSKINPLDDNSTVIISLDGRAVARVNPTPGWRSYIVSSTKSMSIITCSASSINLTLGETVNIRGALTPEAQGATISIKMTGPSGKTNSATITISGEGEYSYSLKPDEKGDWLIQSSWQGDEKYSNSTSYELILRVNEVKPVGITTGIPSYPLTSIIVGLGLVVGVLIRTRAHSILSSAQKRIQMEYALAHSVII